jgi:hypothetical protein
VYYTLVYQVGKHLSAFAFSMLRARAVEKCRLLHRSAALLAIDCAELREAERLIARVLAGNPPDDIANELRDLLLEEVYSQRQAIGH